MESHSLGGRKILGNRGKDRVKVIATILKILFWGGSENPVNASHPSCLNSCPRRAGLCLEIDRRSPEYLRKSSLSLCHLCPSTNCHLHRPLSNEWFSPSGCSPVPMIAPKGIWYLRAHEPKQTTSEHLRPRRLSQSEDVPLHPAFAFPSLFTSGSKSVWSTHDGVDPTPFLSMMLCALRLFRCKTSLVLKFLI